MEKTNKDLELTNKETTLDKVEAVDVEIDTEVKVKSHEEIIEDLKAQLSNKDDDLAKAKGAKEDVKDRADKAKKELKILKETETETVEKLNKEHSAEMTEIKGMLNDYIKKNENKEQEVLIENIASKYGDKATEFLKTKTDNPNLNDIQIEKLIDFKDEEKGVIETSNSSIVQKGKNKPADNLGAKDAKEVGYDKALRAAVIDVE